MIKRILSCYLMLASMMYAGASNTPNNNYYKLDSEQKELSKRSKSMPETPMNSPEDSHKSLGYSLSLGGSVSLLARSISSAFSKITNVMENDQAPQNNNTADNNESTLSHQQSCEKPLPSARSKRGRDFTYDSSPTKKPYEQLQW